MNFRNIATALAGICIAFASCQKTRYYGTPPGTPPVVTPTVTPTPVTNYDFTYSAPAVKDSPVHFSTTATGVNSYLWSFGDGTTSTIANPSHAYSSADNYSVKLVINNDTARAVTKIITVNKDPKYTYQMAGTKSYHHIRVYHSSTAPDSTATYADTLLTISYVNPLMVSLLGDTLSYLSSSTEDVLGFYKNTTGTPVTTRYLIFDRVGNSLDYQVDYGGTQPYLTERFWR